MTALANKTKTCRKCEGDGFITAADERAIARICPHLDDCTECQGSGRTTKRRDGEWVVVPCPCGITAIRRRIALFNDAKLPARFHNAEVSTFRTNKQTFNLRAAFVDLQANFEPGATGIGLTGRPGVGKTHLMTGLAGYLALHRGLRVMFIDFSHLLWALKEGFAQRRSEAELVKPLVAVDVLFIDELGKGKGTDWELSIVDEIVSQRYNRNLSLFFATNYPFAAGGVSGNANDTLKDLSAARVETLEDRVGPRIWSRLQQMCRLSAVSAPDARAGSARTRSQR